MPWSMLDDHLCALGECLVLIIPYITIGTRTARHRPPGSSPILEGRAVCWLSLLVASAATFSLAFACATPFAAIATFAALTLSGREGLAFIGATWILNQVIGFGLLHYPHDLSTYAWGVALAASALAAFGAALFVAGRVERSIATGIAVFASAFCAYEALLFAASLVLGGSTEAVALLIVGRILAINSAALIGLLMLDRLGRLVLLRQRFDRTAATMRPL